MDLARIATVGSVDDGKSTLLGRMFLDSKQIFEDELDAVERTSLQLGGDYTDLALLADGLKAEREQGITIDVAYRYFSTPKRKFILADTPGHIQYTRNMVTGASTADVALVLVDARKGLLEQTRRHAAIASLLRVPHLVVCINKMDLVGYSADRFEELASDFRDFAARLDIKDIRFVPISALKGDNVVEKSTSMAWYSGRTLVDLLETITIVSDRNLIDPRFPVQYVIRPKREEFHDYRSYAGQVAAGVFHVGAEVTVLPSGWMTRIASIETADGQVTEAFPPMSVAFRLEDDLGVSRGDMICGPHNKPQVTQDLDAMVCWLGDRSRLVEGSTYAIQHTTRRTRAIVRDVRYKLDINTLHRESDATELVLNDIGRVTLRTTEPIFCDPYRDIRSTGSFVLIDEATRETVAAGMITSKG